MAVGDWSAATLCTYTDVKERYSRAGALTGESAEVDQNSDLTAEIALAKVRIAKRLDADLKQRRGVEEWDTDDLKDLIANPAVLKEACVALTLARLFEANTIDPEDYNFRQMERYRSEYDEMYNVGLHLVQFDVDESGSIEEAEKGLSTGRYRLERV